MSKLPIDIVPGSCPTHFRWKQSVSVPVDAGMPDDTRVVEVSQPIPVMLERPVLELITTCKKLQMFKDWVHAYLDSRDVPHHPPGEHGAAGCRIGDRMDWVWVRITELEATVAELQRQVASTDNAEAARGADAATKRKR